MTKTMTAASAAASAPARIRSQPALVNWASEAELATAWARCLPGPLRLLDGRPIQVIFPGVPGPGNGPDFRGAVLDAAGDYLTGDIELHLVTSGWVTHGHHQDPAYEGVVLHVAGADDSGRPNTSHRSGRLIPTLIVPPPGEGTPAAGVHPPCVFEARQGHDSLPALERLGLRRLRMKSAKARLRIEASGLAQALYASILETAGGPAHGRSFALLAEALPLRVALGKQGQPGYGVLGAALRACFEELRPLLPVSGRVRPAARPERRLELAGGLIAQLWPTGEELGWPASLSAADLLAGLAAPGVSAELAVEFAVNSVIPFALACGSWSEGEVMAAWGGLPSLPAYGHLRPLQRWLAGAPEEGARVKQWPGWAASGGAVVAFGLLHEGAVRALPAFGGARNED